MSEKNSALEQFVLNYIESEAHSRSIKELAQVNYKLQESILERIKDGEPRIVEINGKRWIVLATTVERPGTDRRALVVYKVEDDVRGGV